MNRTEAIQLIDKHIANKNLKKHLLATEACMKKLAEHFGEDTEQWSITGLVHDIDYEMTKDDPSLHGELGGEMLTKYQLPPDSITAIKLHGKSSVPPGLLANCLYAVDPLTGLIVAAALMHPEKKLASLDLKFIQNRFKEKRFAAGANREQIQSIQNTGLDLDDFIELALSAMTEIADDLGL
ncbi:MAG: phosphohydrolase [Desulfuromonas sp. SDB]|nr:MAG: phosphohydrolase [Desulfuromonas sp. SDB]